MVSYGHRKSVSAKANIIISGKRPYPISNSSMASLMSLLFQYLNVMIGSFLGAIKETRIFCKII